MITADDTFTVWRRHPDGHVNASAGSRLPAGWTHPGASPGDDRVAVTFEELLVTGDWPAAHARIRAEHIADDMTGHPHGDGNAYYTRAFAAQCAALTEPTEGSS
jgi:hypothetical protein